MTTLPYGQRRGWGWWVAHDDGPRWYIPDQTNPKAIYLDSSVRGYTDELSGVCFQMGLFGARGNLLCGCRISRHGLNQCLEELLSDLIAVNILVPTLQWRHRDQSAAISDLADIYGVEPWVIYFRQHLDFLKDNEAPHGV